MSGDGARPETVVVPATVRSRTPMRPADAIRTASAVADEVAALHAAGRAHGRVGPGTVALRDDGGATLIGPPAPKSGPAAPPALRAADLHGVGAVLAAALGWPAGRLPAPVAGLVAAAEATDAPAAALAAALHRLTREPLEAAALAPAPQEALPPADEVDRLPRTARTKAGFAAAVVGGVAVLGGVLLLVGAPADARRAPTAASSRSIAGPASPPGVVEDALPPTVQDLLRSDDRAASLAPPAPKSTRSTPRVEHRTTSVPTVAVTPITAPRATPTPTRIAPTPTARPTSTPTAAPTPQPTSPTPTGAPTPTRAPTATPATTAPAATAPTAVRPSPTPSR